MTKTATAPARATFAGAPPTSPPGLPERRIAFEKYSVLGNTFLFVDESFHRFRDDRERAAFARAALDDRFGVGGADNVIYLARVGNETTAPYSFRIFEHDGTETLSCGNALLSTAALLSRESAATGWRVLTELPTGRPRPVQVGVGAGTGLCWLDAGLPRTPPPGLVAGPLAAADGWTSAGVRPVDGLVVDLPRDRVWSRGLPPVLPLAGWFVFTGEPHLVFVLGRGLPAVLGDRLFPPTETAAGNELVDHLGVQVNARYRDRFPAGVHLNVVDVRADGDLRYRTWERAINRETFACGSGALAVAYVVDRQLGRPAGRSDRAGTGRMTLRPHRAGWQRSAGPPGAAELVVTATSDRLVLEGRPTHLYSGVVPAGALSMAALSRSRDAAVRKEST